MSKPLLSITDFSAGILDDETAQANNGFSKGVEIDIHDKPGFLRPSFSVAQESTTTGLITAIDNHDGDGTNKLYGFTGSLIYKRTTTTWSLDRTLSGVTALTVAGDMVEWNSALYYTTKNDIGRLVTTSYDDTYLTVTLSGAFTANSTQWKPMKSFLDKLFIGDGRYIASLDTAAVWNATALTLPDGYVVRALEVIGDRLAIACGDSTNNSGSADYSTVFFWDGTSDLYESKVQVDAIGGICAVKEIDNILYLFARNIAPPTPAGIDIYYYNGADFELLKTVVNGTSVTDSSVMYPNAVANYNNNLIFGTTRDAGTTSQLHGVWKLGRYNRNYPRTLILENLVSDSTTSDVSIGAIKVFDDLYFVANKTGSTSRVDKLSITTANSSAYIETQEYELTNDDEKTLVKGVKIFAKPLPASTSVVVKYDLDRTGSWTTLGTITSANQSDILYGIYKRGDTIKLRIELNSSTTTYPEIYKINLF